MAEPFRRCIGCRRLHPRSQLLRLVRSGDGLVRLDTGRHSLAGRGAYVCLKGTCWQKICGRRSLDKALKMPIPSQFWIDFEAFFKP